jgi:hypothetical protein
MDERVGGIETVDVCPPKLAPLAGSFLRIMIFCIALAREVWEKG